MPSNYSADQPIWDRVVRLCHWGLALSFFVNYFIVEPGRLWHEIAGYIGVGLLGVRIVWGIYQPLHSHASFKKINVAPSAFRAHIAHLSTRAVPHDSGHNPAGWVMIFLVAILFSGLGITGFMMEEVDAFFGNALVERVHSVMAGLLYLAVILHVIAVVLTQWWGKIPLVKAMITGRR